MLFLLWSVIIIDNYMSSSREIWNVFSQAQFEY